MKQLNTRLLLQYSVAFNWKLPSRPPEQTMGEAAYLLPRLNRRDVVENNKHQRRIQERGRNGKRQGTKRGQSEGMSLLVAIRSPTPELGQGTAVPEYRNGARVRGGDAYNWRWRCTSLRSFSRSSSRMCTNSMPLPSGPMLRTTAVKLILRRPARTSSLIESPTVSFRGDSR